MTTSTSINRRKRHARIRAKVQGTAVRPRLAVYRSNKSIYAQLIDDTAARTVAAVDSRAVSGATPQEKAIAVGTAIAAVAKAAGYTTAVFDRGGYRYHGNVQAIAEAARAGGLQF